jgi:hypothetical protein
MVRWFKHILCDGDIHPLFDRLDLSCKHLLAGFVWCEVYCGVLFNHAAAVS